MCDYVTLADAHGNPVDVSTASAAELSTTKLQVVGKCSFRTVQFGEEAAHPVLSSNSCASAECMRLVLGGLLTEQQYLTISAWAASLCKDTPQMVVAAVGCTLC
jgi:hypothetical protein